MAADVDAYFASLPPGRTHPRSSPARVDPMCLRKQPPTDLLGRMIRFRINEYEPGGVKWI